jgi:hypothetical protein
MVAALYTMVQVIPANGVLSVSELQSEIEDSHLFATILGSGFQKS